jgi:hypothetical protein
MVLGLRHISFAVAAAALIAGCAGSDTPADSTSTGEGAGTGEGGSTESGQRPTTTSTSSGFGGDGGGSSCTGEVCDGEDNDCDGETDEGCECVTGETQPCYGGPAETRGEGACTDGEQVCDDFGKWGPCEGEVLPSDEVCDGADNDCNGETDEIAEAVTCGDGACQVTVPSCENGVEQECVPLEPVSTVEQCDGTDDNCDGIIDDGCTCTNGSTQPCYSGADGTLGVGACKAGTQTCQNGQWGACQGEVAPTTEVCDAVDQNCDGNVNQGTCNLANAISSCGGATGCQISVCNAGYSHCDTNQANGCETRHSGHSNSLATAEYLGGFAADAFYGAGCGGGTCDGPLVTETGTRGRFFTIDAYEDSTCAGYVSLAFELSVPPGADYDLYVDGSYCFVDPASSASLKGTGEMEEIVVWCDDTFAVDDSFYVDVEVRYYSGSSCQPWELRVYHRAC